MGRTVKGAVLAVQEESSRTNYFSLRPGFDSIFTDIDVRDIERTENGEKKVVGHRVIGRGKGSKSSLHGNLIKNSFLVTEEEFKKIKKTKLVKTGVKACWWFDNVQMHASTTVEDLWELNENGEFKDFEYPEQFQILGAAVFEAQEGEHPMVPLFNYPGYKILRKHHRTLMDDERAVPSYWDCKMYAELTGESRPKGLLDDFKFEIPDSTKWDQRKWIFRLIIKDWR